MAASNQAGGKKEEGEGEKWRECLGREDSREFDNSLFFEYEFSIDQLIEIAGLCVAQVCVCVCVPVLHGCIITSASITVFVLV